MIQVCSSCATRWNVRDKQRAWCPRCQGSLLPPFEAVPADGRSAAPGASWSRPTAGVAPGAAAGSGAQQSPQRGRQRLPSGYRWIAVRPGAAPTQRRRRRPLGPTPRYEITPRWGLGDQIGYVPPAPAPVRTGPSPGQIRFILSATAIALGAAAFAYLVRYVLLLINRTRLLNTVVAGTAQWLAIVLSVIAFVTVIACWVVLTRWLIARRGAVYAHLGATDPRSPWELGVGSLAPLANLLLAPVFVIETAAAEGIGSRLRKPIVVWWVLWVLSAAVSLFAFLTSSSLLKAAFNYVFGTALTQTAQGIADNHVATICAYLIALAAVLAFGRVYRGFESKAVDRPTHRWVIVAADTATARSEPVLVPAAPAEGQSVAAVESTGQEPAA